MKIGFSTPPHPEAGSVGTYCHHLSKILTELAPEHEYYDVGSQCETGVDIYHCIGLPARGMRLGRGVQSVVTVVDLKFLVSPQIYSLADRWVRFRQYGRFYRTASCLIVLSRAMGELLVDRLGVDPRRIEVVDALGVHPPIVEMGEATLEKVGRKYALPKRYVVVFCVPEMRQELFEVFDALRGVDSDCSLLVCGRRSAYADFLLRYARGTGGARRIEFIYEPSVGELPVLLRGARACVSMAEAGAEGVLHPLVEALRSEVPLVLSDTPCHREAAAEAALYVPAGSEVQLAAALRHVLREGDAVRLECVERGRRRAEHFSQEAVARRMLEIYASLESGRRGR